MAEININLSIVLGGLCKATGCYLPPTGAGFQGVFVRTSDGQSHTSRRHGSLRPPLGLAGATLEDPGSRRPLQSRSLPRLRPQRSPVRLCIAHSSRLPSLPKITHHSFHHPQIFLWFARFRGLLSNRLFFLSVLLFLLLIPPIGRGKKKR